MHVESHHECEPKITTETRFILEFELELLKKLIIILNVNLNK